MRFSLLVFLVMISLLGAAIGLCGRGYFRESVSFYSYSRGSQEKIYYTYAARTAGFLQTCDYLVMKGRFGTFPVNSTSYCGVRPLEDGISYQPEGFFFKGKCVWSSGSGVALFVIKGEQVYEVQLSAEEERLIRHFDFESLKKLPVHAKVEDFLADDEVTDGNKSIVPVSYP